MLITLLLSALHPPSHRDREKSRTGRQHWNGRRREILHLLGKRKNHWAEWRCWARHTTAWMWWSGATAFNHIELALGKTWAQHVVCWGRNQSMVQRNMANILTFNLCTISQSPSYLTLKKCVSALMQTGHIRPSFTFLQIKVRLEKSLLLLKKGVVTPLFS